MTSVGVSWQVIYVCKNGTDYNSQALSSPVEQTGKMIEPFQVRLRPKIHDYYTWDILKPECAPLFEKNLSDHTISSLKVICSQLRLGFRAISTDGTGAVLSRRASSAGAWMGVGRSADSSKLHDDLVCAQAQIEQLQAQLRAANHKIDAHESTDFEHNFLIERIANLLEEYRESNQNYSVVA